MGFLRSGQKTSPAFVGSKNLFAIAFTFFVGVAQFAGSPPTLVQVNTDSSTVASSTCRGDIGAFACCCRRSLGCTPAPGSNAAGLHPEIPKTGVALAAVGGWALCPADCGIRGLISVPWPGKRRYELF